MIWFPFLLFLTCTRGLGEGANILAIVPTPSFSHQLFYRSYFLELNKRGHSLTVATTDPLRNPALKNYREIDLSYMYEEFRKILDVSSGTRKVHLLFAELLFIIYAKVLVSACHAALSNPNILDLYRGNEKFDLVVFEWGVASCFYPFEKLSDGKLIGISSFELGTIPHMAMGGVWPAAYASDPALGFPERKTLLQRLRSVIYNLNSFLFIKTIKWVETNIARQYFGPDMKNPFDIEANVSLVFDNSHVTMSYPRATNVNFVSLGGPAFHLKWVRPKPLPKDIKAFLDDAPDGVIYFSLGTNVKTGNISSDEENILLESFSRLKQKVLWKWENEHLTVKSNKVMKRKWFPQVDVLSHPNVKAFVTQAGLQSVGEAIEFHVPMIVIPFFADQNHNARKMEAEGLAVYLDYDDLDVATFTRAINEVIYNKTYKDNVVRFSALVKDQPIPPLEKAVWWTEYVIRHNGAPHLRSAAAMMPWYQYLMLDVLAVIFLALFIIFYALYLILRTIYRSMFTTRKAKSD